MNVIVFRLRATRGRDGGDGHVSSETMCKTGDRTSVKFACNGQNRTTD